MGSDWGTADVRFINSTSDCESVSSPSFNAYRSGASTLNVKNEPLIITFDEIARLGGGYVDVTVSYVEGVESFYVQPMRMKEDIERITQELQIFDNSQSFASLPEQFELIPGFKCAARYSLDKSWYRTEVLERVGAAKWKVRFIDFGNVEVLPVSEFRKFGFSQLSLVDMPQLAFRCELTNVDSKKVESQTFRLALEGGQFVIRVHSQIQKNKYSVTLYYVVGEEEVEINWRLNKGLPIFPAAPEPTPQVLLPVNEPSVPHSPPQPSTTCRGPQKKNRVLYNLSPTTDDRIQIAQPSLLDSCQLNRPPDDPEIANVTCRTSSLSGFDLTSSAGPSMKHTFIVPSTDIRYKGNPETVVKSIINHPSAAKNIPVPSISGMLATEIVEESWWKRGLYDTNFSYPQAVVPKKTVMAKFLCIHTCNEVFVKLEISVNKCNWDLICKSLETHYSHAEIIPSLQVSDFSVGSVFVVQSSNRQWHRAQFQNGNVILCVDSGEKLLPTLSTIAKPLHPNLIRIPPVALKCVLTNVANQPDYRKQPSKWCRAFATVCKSINERVLCKFVDTTSNLVSLLHPIHNYNLAVTLSPSDYLKSFETNKERVTLNNGDLLSRSGGIERAKIEERHFTCDLDKILNGGEIFSEEESSGEEPKKKTKETLKQRKRRKAMEEIDKQRRRQKDESASQQHLLVSSSVVSQQSTDQNVDTGANLRRFPLAKMALFSGYSTVLRVTFVLSPLDFSVILDEMMGTIEEMSEKLDGCYKLDTNPIPDGELTPGLHCVVWDATAGKWARAILLSQLSPDQFSYVNVDDGTRGFVNHRAHIKNILPQFETPRLSYRCGLKKFENQSDSSCTWNENERFKERLFASDNRVVCHFFPRNMVNDRYYIDLFDLKGNQYNSVDNEQKEKIRESEVQLPNESDFLLHINGAQEELDLPSANEINEWDDTDLVDEYRKNHRISKFDCKVEAWLDAYEGPHESSNSKPEEETVGFTDSFPSLEDALEANHIIDGFSLRYPPGPDAPNIPTEMFFSHVESPLEIYLQTEIQIELAADQSEKLNTRISRVEKSENEDWELQTISFIDKNCACAVQFDLDGMWYRGKIVQVRTNNDCIVQFVDYGNSQLVKSADLKPLPSDHRQPITIYKCRLSEYTPIGPIQQLRDNTSFCAYVSENFLKTNRKVICEFLRLESAKVRNLNTSAYHDVTDTHLVNVVDALSGVSVLELFKKFQKEKEIAEQEKTAKTGVDHRST